MYVGGCWQFPTIFAPHEQPELWRWNAYPRSPLNRCNVTAYSLIAHKWGERVMRFRRSASYIVPGLTALILAGCGGGGGGGGGYSAPAPVMAAAPTVSFTSPSQAESINLGQAVKLEWTSTGATSCTASSSGTIGGAFSGNQAIASSAMVAPTGTGSVTYTLTCTGAGGMASVTTNTVTVNPSILSTLDPTKIATVGLTTSAAANAGNNPYGLVIAPATSGPITQGDLIVCNFNNAALTGPQAQGTGTDIVGLHPNAASPTQVPYAIANDPALLGCNALTMLPDDTISAAAFYGSSMTGENPLVTASGVVSNPLGTAGDTFHGPWGEAYAPANGSNPAAVYVSNYDGTIDRVALNGDVQSSFLEIAKGFCGSGSPGGIYAPAGLTYDPAVDTLYVVDTSSNSVVALLNVSSIGQDGVVVAGQCTTGTPPVAATPPTSTPTFSGPSMASAEVIAHGGAFNAPISAALLSDGNLLVTNGDLNDTANIPVAMQNLVMEVSPYLPGGFVGQPVQLDGSGTAAALFGLVTTTDAQKNTIVYFNDDNANAVMVLSK
jgi:hypothetical protein